jgi:hypothetical protein
MNKKVFVYGIFALIIFAVSCNSKNRNSKVVSTDFVQNSTERKKDTVSQQLHPNIWEVSEKMEKQEKSTTSDYDCICDFLLNNNDESKSEELGYILFEYLKNKPLNNSAFLSYLSKKETYQKEKFLTALIQIMCIDIGEENYSYGAFVKDFDMFSNSTSAKKAFNECMSNQ